MTKNLLTEIFVFCTFLLTIFLTNYSFGGCSPTTASGNNCSLSTTAPVGGDYGLGSNTYSGVSPTCVGINNPTQDGWYTYTPTTTGIYNITIGSAGGNIDTGISLYSGTCGDLTPISCSQANDQATAESILGVPLEAGQTYYIQIFTVSGNDGACGPLTISMIPQSNTTTCSATIFDPGGSGGSTTTSGFAGNYANNVQQIYTYCSSDPSNPYVTVNFSAFSLEDNFDFLTIYDGLGTNNVILGIYTGNNNPGTITSSTGCLTFYFTSDAVGNRLGWQASVSCTNVPGVLPDPSFADCLGAIGLCSTFDATLSGQGSGAYDDLNSLNHGCLRGENNTVWYFVTIDDANNDGIDNNIPGTFGFTLTMPNQVDYDYAVWGPLESNDPIEMCSNLGAPTRCSWSAASGNSNTTMGMNGTNDPNQVSENGGTNEDGWVYWLDDVRDGETYIIVIDRFGVSDVHDYDLSFTGTAGTGGLDCAVTLPVELFYFEVFHFKDRFNQLVWKTASENNSSHYQIERSKDGVNWDIIGSVGAAGQSTTLLSYSFYDDGYFSPISYYRIKSIDFDGQFKYSPTRAVSSDLKISGLFSDIFPNPANESFYMIYGGGNSEESIEVTILSMNGSVVFDNVFNDISKSQGIEIPTSTLANGMYQVIIRQGDYQEVKKVSVIH